MGKVLFALIVCSAAASLLSGCEPAPSTPIAPDVKGPDFSKMSGKEMMEYKKGHLPQTNP